VPLDRGCPSGQATLDGPDQLFRGDWLAKHAGVIERLGAPGYDDNRNGSRKFLMDGVAAERGKQKIQHHEVGRMLLNGDQCGESVARFARVEPRELQHGSIQPSKIRVVLDDQNALHTRIIRELGTSSKLSHLYPSAIAAFPEEADDILGRRWCRVGSTIAHPSASNSFPSDGARSSMSPGSLALRSTPSIRSASF
jgi:hypothetical protein